MSIKSALVGAAVLAALFLWGALYGQEQYRKGYELAQAQTRRRSCRPRSVRA